MTEYGGWPYFAIGSAVYWAMAISLFWLMTQAGNATINQYLDLAILAVLPYGLLIALWRPWKRGRKAHEGVPPLSRQ